MNINMNAMNDNLMYEMQFLDMAYEQGWLRQKEYDSMRKNLRVITEFHTRVINVKGMKFEI